MLLELEKTSLRLFKFLFSTLNSISRPTRSLLSSDYGNRTLRPLVDGTIGPCRLLLIILETTSRLCVLFSELVFTNFLHFYLVAFSTTCDFWA